MGSCVANRTRARTGAIKQENLSQIMADCTDPMQESFEVIGNSMNDSDWDQNCIGRIMSELDSSIDKAKKIFSEKRMEECIKKGENAAKDICKYEGEKGVTFTIEQNKYGTALEEVIGALERILDMKIDSAPRKSAENIIKYILSVCIDSNLQIRAAQDTIITMARIIDDLSRKNEKELDQGKEKEIKNLKEKNRYLQEKHDNIKVLHDSLRTYADELERAIGNDNEGKKDMEDIIKTRVEIKKLEVEGNCMRTELAEMIQKYNGLLNKKEDYKKKCERQEKELKAIKVKMEEEVEEIKDRLNSEAMDCNRWRKQYHDLSEKLEVYERLTEDQAGDMRKMRDKHEREMKDVNDCYHLEVEGMSIEIRDVRSDLENERQNLSYQ